MAHGSTLKDGQKIPEAGNLGGDGKPERAIYIREFRVAGVGQLTRADVENAVYPFSGPGRTSVDIEKARAALEAAYRAKGFQTVSVEVPQQAGRGGIIYLQVQEATVGRLRVKGSRYFSLEAIKRGAPSMAEGKVVNFNEVTADILALNQFPDRRVTPTMRAGVQPQTVDIDLTVQDTFPLHGSVELNNRYSEDTTHLRLNGSFSYSNLWQLGHGIGGSFQIAPERLADAKVFSGYYLARVQGVEWLTLMLQGTKQDSDVSSLGGTTSAGRGEILGARANLVLPRLSYFYHSLSLGLDYKHFRNRTTIPGLKKDDAALIDDVPITYFPFSVAYSGTWAGKGYETELNTSLVFGIRGAGSSDAEFDQKRFKSGGNFFYVRGDLAHTHDLPLGLEFYGKMQGQASSSALIDSEQFSAGGLGTIRGYLESAAIGDNAILGSVEIRSPSFTNWLGKKVVSEWRLYAFSEAGRLALNDPLPEQQDIFELASVGVGSHLTLWNRLNGSLDAGLPLLPVGRTRAYDLLLTFRLWAEF